MLKIQNLSYAYKKIQALKDVSFSLQDGEIMSIIGANGAGKLWGDRIFEKCGIRRDEEGDGGKTLEIRGKRRLSARDGGANYQQS